MKIALCQIDTTVGAVDGNASAVLAALARAREAGASLAVFPELAIPGYPPLDLLERRTFVEACARADDRIATEMPAGITAVYGNVHLRPSASTFGRPLQNVAVVAERGRIQKRIAKSLLPTYDVFDEARYFEPSPSTADNLIEIGGKRVGITICEDMWNDRELWEQHDLWRDKAPGTYRLYEMDPVEEIVAKGAEILLNISASPWSLGKLDVRRRLLKHTALRHGVWAVYVNLVGANDGLIFDGQSLVYSPEGKCTDQGDAWKEGVQLAELVDGRRLEPHLDQEPIAAIRDGLVLGVRDYFRKTGLERAVVGLSGGIDSAIAAYIGTLALGPENVIGVGMPSRYSSDGSVTDARRLAENLGIRFEIVPIEPMFTSYLDALAPVFAGRAPDVTEENIQSRIRGVTLMAIANKFGAVVLGTGNKSEASMGYATLYGDTIGALCVLADLYKHQVYALAHLANREREIIPESVITKAPSAELRPNQKDEDTLPPYAKLDRMLEAFIEDRATAEEMAVAAGTTLESARAVMRSVYLNEFKRKQMPPTLRVSQKSWVGRVYPIVQRFTE